MGSKKIIGLLIALTMYLCTSTAQDTLHVAQFLNIGAITQVSVAFDTITAGQQVFVKQFGVTAGKCARAETGGIGGSFKKESIGIALISALPGDTTIICRQGRIIDYPTALNPNDIYYLSHTGKGLITNNKPSLPDLPSRQKVGFALDTFVFLVEVLPTEELIATQPLSQVTSVGATSYNDMSVSDGVFNTLVLAGSDTARISFTDPIGEGRADLIGPPKGSLESNLKWRFPNKSGTVAFMDDVGGGSTPTLDQITTEGNISQTPIVLGGDNTHPGALYIWSNQTVPPTWKNYVKMYFDGISEDSVDLLLPQRSGRLALLADLGLNTVLENNNVANSKSIEFQFEDANVLRIGTIDDTGKILYRQPSTDKTIGIVLPDGDLSDNYTVKLPKDNGSLAIQKYKVYTALLTQSSTDAPVATVLENTLGVTPTWKYNSNGNYSIQCSACFTDGKTFVTMGPLDLSASGEYDITLSQHINTSGDIGFFTYSISDVAFIDGRFFGFLEIRVYP
jgi:hypothetical protein